MIYSLLLSSLLVSPQGFDFTIQSSASSVDLGGSVTTGIGGELIGDYDATTNPGGTLTRPGLFGGSGNLPAACDFDLQVAISTLGVPDGSFHMELDLPGLALDVSDLQLQPFGTSGTTVDLSLVLTFETFRTFAPDSVFFGGIPLPIPLGSVALNDAVFTQSGPSTLGVLVPDAVIADRYNFAVTVPAELSANVDFLGNLFPIGPVPFAYVLAGSLDVSQGSVTAIVTADQSINQNIPNPAPGSFGPFPIPLPTILPPGGTASLLFSGAITGLDIILDVDVDVVADGVSAGCGTEIYCSAAPNSVGAGANISLSGSTSVSANDLALQAGPVPNQPGIFFFGPNQIEMPFGNGYRCVGGAVKRLPVVFATGGAIDYSIDNTQFPASGSLIAGSTWNFQAWYRDPAGGGSNFNLSDAVRVDFCR